MFGYSIKEVLEDNSMDIYMIMEALDTQKIHWYTLYFQVKPVPYGNFIPGRFYIDPYDVISDIREE